MWRAVVLLIPAAIVRSEIERNTARAVFIPETPVIISSGLEATWVTVPIPGLPAINLTHLDLAYQEFQLNLAIKWRGYDGTICGDQETHDRLLNSTYVTIKGVEYEVQETEKGWRDIKDRIGTFVNGTTNPHHGRELTAFKVALHNFGYVLDDALGSLAQGHIPATLIPPEVLLQLLDGRQLDTQNESIPRHDLMTYYGFELVESTIVTHNRLNILLNFPVHHTNGFHRVYRAVPIPQPIANGSI